MRKRTTDRKAGSVVAAYEFGYLWNRLAWYAPQAWLMANSEARSDVCRVFEELAQKIRQLAPPRERGRVEQIIRNAATEWQSGIESWWHADELIEENEWLLQRLPMAEDLQAEREQSISRLLLSVTSLLERLKAQIVAELDDDQVLAWELGARIDQGLRPPDGWRYLHDSTCGRSATTTRKPRGFGAARSESPARENLLANCEVAPGELPPEPAWLTDVQYHFAEMSPRVPFPPELVSWIGQPVSTDITSVVDQLDRVVRSALAATSPVTPIRKKDLEARDKWIYDKCCEPVEYKQILAELKRQYPTWEEITTVPGIRNAARRYANRHNLPAPPPRQNK